MSLPAVASGSADKATGSGYWTNAQGLDFYAEFNAHEASGNRAAKGSLLQDRVDGLGGFVVNVDWVNVDDNGAFACFGGYTTDAWGAYAAYEGDYRWTVVLDGGDGKTENTADYLRGGWSASKPAFCDTGDVGANEAWSGGNVQIHLGKAHQ